MAAVFSDSATDPSFFSSAAFTAKDPKEFAAALSARPPSRPCKVASVDESMRYASFDKSSPPIITPSPSSLPKPSASTGATITNATASERPTAHFTALRMAAKFDEIWS